jgi:hypothetical protein
MMDPKTRRGFLQATGSPGPITLAGCTGGDSGTERGTDDSEMTEDGIVRPLDDVDDGHEYPAVGDAVQVIVTRH